MKERKVRGSSRGQGQLVEVEAAGAREVDRARRVAARQLVVERDRRAPRGQGEDDLAGPRATAAATASAAASATAAASCRTRTRTLKAGRSG